MEIDVKDLKIQALTERVASLTADYENKVADLRVELTVVSHERDGLSNALQELSNKDADVPEDSEANSE